MTVVSAYGLSVDVPLGWEAVIYQRPASVSGSTHPVLHAGTFALPVDRGDFGSGAVDLMGWGDAFVVVLEYHPSSAGTALFSRRGLPRSLSPDLFSPATLQRGIPGHAGVQSFFNEAGRAFCLYAVIGSFTYRSVLAPEINALLSGIQIGSNS